MKDPVTAVTGITYDRDSIERWLTSPSAAPAVCPVTKQPLSRAVSELTPNHMLRRLIQAWCVVNADNGVDRIPTPKSPARRPVILKLIRDVNNGNFGGSLKKLEEIADEGEKNQKSMADAGVAKAMVSFILKCFKDVKTVGIDRALRILHLTWGPTSSESKKIVGENLDFVESIFWVLNMEMENSVKTQALLVLKNVMESASESFIEGSNTDFFKKMVEFLRMNISPAATRAILQILTETCRLGRSKSKMVEAGAVFELVEMELAGNAPEKRTTELIFYLLAHLCSFADGRQQLLRHAGGLAVVAKRLLRVSPATDELALSVLESIARFSATRAVVAEMMRVDGVSKLCMVLQADCGGHLKKKAREILRLHSKAWSNSPCIQVYLFTRCPR